MADEMMTEQPASESKPETPAAEAPKPPKPKPAKPPALPTKGAKGKGKTKGKTSVPEPERPTVDTFAKAIEGLHGLVAAISQDPAYLIRPEQARMIAEPAHKVIDQYNLWWLFQAMPLVELAVAVAVVEGPLVMHTVVKLRQRREQKQAAQRGGEAAHGPAITVVRPGEPAPAGPSLG